MLKRPLPVYDDLIEDLEDREAGEDGEVAFSSLSLSASASSDVESDEEFALKPVLPVGKFDGAFTEADEPATGEQYLCLVKHERKRLPRTEVASESASFGNLKSIEELISGFCGSSCVKVLDGQWAEHFWNTYQQYDAAMQCMLDSIEEVNVQLPGTKDQNEWLNYLRENTPSTEICVALQEEQELVCKLIQHYTNWIQNGTYRELEWLSSLLLCLDRHLSSQQISSLRGLVKALATLENNSKADELLLIVVKTYGQHDLVTFK